MTSVHSPDIPSDLLLYLSRLLVSSGVFQLLAELRRNWQALNDGVIDGRGVLVLVGVGAPSPDCQAIKASRP